MPKTKSSTGGFFHRNGLSIVLVSLFVIFLSGQSIVGFRSFNSTLEAHHRSPVGFMEYLTKPHFYSKVFENWESEFLEMTLFVLLSAWLQQKGSSESKDLDSASQKETPDKRRFVNIPKWARARGFSYAIYKNSLTIALFLLFAFNFILHLYSGAKEYNFEQHLHGGQGKTMFQFLGAPEFWFESLQNWQSEFFGVAWLAVLSIWLRQEGSPQSKPVGAPDSKTGG